LRGRSASKEPLFRRCTDSLLELFWRSAASFSGSHEVALTLNAGLSNQNLMGTSLSGRSGSGWLPGLATAQDIAWVSVALCNFDVGGVLTPL